MLTTTDWVVIVVYFIALVVVSIFASRQIKTAEDYHFGGRAFGFLLIIGTLTATSIGGGATMGRSGVAYTEGISILWAIIAVSVGNLLFAYFLVPRIRKLHKDVWTISDLLREQFGNAVRILGALFLLIGLVTIYGVQVGAFGILLTMVGGNFGITFPVAVLIGGGFMVLYTFLGGLVAVAWTDLVQTFIKVVLIVVILPIMILSKAGDFGSLFAQIPAQNLDFFRGVSFWLIIGWIVAFVAAPITDASKWQRTMAARTDKIAFNASVGTSIAFFIWGCVIVFLGVVATSILPNVIETYGSADSVILALMVNYLPAGLVGLGIAAMLAVIMSTGDTCLQVGSLVFNRDILTAIKGGLTDGQLLVYSRWATLGFGVIGIAVAIYASGLFQLMYLGYVFFNGSMLFPILCALFWPRVNQKAVVVSIIASFLVIGGLYVAGTPWGIEPIIPGIVVSGLVILIGSLVFKNDKAVPVEESA